MTKKGYFKEEPSGILLPMFRFNFFLKSLLQVVDWGEDYFFQLHGWTFTICVIIAQIRSRSMSAKIKDHQEILRLSSVNFYIKHLAHDQSVSNLARLYALDRVLPYLDNSDPGYINLFKEKMAIPGGQATTKL